MAPALMEQDVVGLWKWGNPQVGDVVGYIPDEESALSFKRLIAVGPAEIGVGADGGLLVDGVPVQNHGVSSSAFSAPGCGQGELETVVEHWGSSEVEVLPGGTSFTEVTIPAGSVYLLGDNRPASSDSRHVGPISKDRILGVATRVLWARDSCSGSISWERVGLNLR